MRQLVDSWVRAEREHYGLTLAAALRLLQERTGARATHGRVGEWRRGKYAPKQAVLSYMLWRSLPWMLRKVDVNLQHDRLLQLVLMLWVIESTGDRTTLRLL